MRRALFAALLGCGVVAPSQAALIYSTGFEDPPFTAGNLAGQDAWDRFDEPGATPAITVQTSQFQSGAQAVQFTNSTATPLGSSFAFRDFTTFNPVTAGTPLVVIDWDMRVANGGTNSGDWFIEAFDDATSLNLVAGAGMGRSGSSTFLSGTDADGKGVDYGTGQALDTWKHYTLTLDYGLGVYAIDFNGARAYGLFATGNGGTFGEIDLVSNARGTDTAFFDNLTINTATGTVPEPASLALIGVAGAMLMGGRRRKA